MRLALVAVAALLLASPAAAREASTFTVSATGSHPGAAVTVSGRLTGKILDGATVRASVGGGTVTAKSYSWSWRQSAAPDMGPVTQTMTLKVQISTVSGLADCAAGTNGVVKLVDSAAKTSSGKPKDSISAGHWSAPCKELTLTLANAGTAKASVTIRKK